MELLVFQDGVALDRQTVLGLPWSLPDKASQLGLWGPACQGPPGDPQNLLSGISGCFQRFS